jgi:hypothetical protein
MPEDRANDPSRVYRKGEGKLDSDGRHTGLRTAANKQRINESSADRGLSDAERFNRDVASGVQGARNAVSGVTVAEATENPTLFGGPVSGSAMARMKDIKAEKKRSAEKEKKRR